MRHVTEARTRVAAALLVDECVIKRPVAADSHVIDETTLERVATEPETVYTGSCLVNLSPPRSAFDPTGQETSSSQARIRIPADSATVNIDDQVTINASVNEQLVGQSFTVEGVDPHSLSVTRRLLVRASERVQ